MKQEKDNQEELTSQKNQYLGRRTEVAVYCGKITKIVDLNYERVRFVTDKGERYVIYFTDLNLFVSEFNNTPILWLFKCTEFECNQGLVEVTVDIQNQLKRFVDMYNTLTKKIKK